MLWTLFVVLLLAWLIGVIVAGPAMILIHLLLVAALVVFVFRLLEKKP
jgi:hypothetical protein